MYIPPNSLPQNKSGKGLHVEEYGIRTDGSKIRTLAQYFHLFYLKCGIEFTSVMIVQPIRYNTVASTCHLLYMPQRAVWVSRAICLLDMTNLMVPSMPQKSECMWYGIVMVALWLRQLPIHVIITPTYAANFWKEFSRNAICTGPLTVAQVSKVISFWRWVAYFC